MKRESAVEGIDLDFDFEIPGPSEKQRLFQCVY